MSTPIGSSQWMYATGAEVTQQSLKFNDDESQYLSWTPAAAGNRKTWTWSGWVKRGNLGTLQGLFHCYDGASSRRGSIVFNADNTIGFDQGGSGSSGLIDTVAVFRDTSAWYHIVVAADYSNGTASDRAKIYVNGVLQSVSTSDDFDNADGLINSTNAHQLGSFDGSGQFLDSYLSDVHFIDGQALDASSFGQFTNGYWEKIDYAGTYGTNGFHLTFEDDVVSEGFNAVTYRGTGATQSVSGLGLEADLVWIKVRNNPNNHRLFDSVRGASSDLISNSTSAESITSTRLLSFDTDGFTVGSNAEVNGSGYNHVAWAWDAGSGSAASNTDGSITSTVKANPSYGFSIVSYTGNATAGATVGHGLGSDVKAILCKQRDGGTYAWNSWHVGLSNDHYIQLNTTSAEDNSAFVWDTSGMTSSVFTHGAAGSVMNFSGNSYIAYCFAEVAGYSSIGSYTGNGSTSGPTVTTNFNPAFLLVKRTDTTGNWFIWDNTRDTDGVFNTNIHPNSSAAEATSGSNFVTPSSTGFQLTGTGAETNASGGTYIYMAFADTREAAFWKDVSGQGNHWTPNNLDYRDSLIDSPANNFATFNALAGGTRTLSEGNLKQYLTATSRGGPATFTVPQSGKWYWETMANDSNGNLGVGVSQDSQTFWTSFNAALNASYYANGEYKIESATQTSGFSAYGNGDILSLAVDADVSPPKIYFGYNGTWQNSADPAAGTGGFNLTSGKTYLPMMAHASGSSSSTTTMNFGQDSTFAGATTAGGNQDDNGIGDFKHPVPSGFLALATANLPTPTIVDGSEYFNTVLYTGNASTNAVTGVGFDLSADGGLVWMKNRASAYFHGLYDSVRGTGITKSLYSNATDAEGANSANQNLVSFDSDGFTLGSTTGTNAINTSGQSHVAWNWKAGGTAVSNTDGSITSQVSANVDAGFSIVSYTGTGSSTTTGHGLNSAPELVIIKDRDSAQDWNVYHADVGTTNILALNSTSAAYADGAAMINSTAPTSSVVHIGFGGASNGSGRDYIAYCFHSVDGFSKVGSYTGNGSNDGPFVFTGGRVQWLMIKRTDGASQWFMLDSVRDTYNVMDSELRANQSNAESSSVDLIDFTSNGFKVRHNATSISINESGGSFIYLAILESPLKFATAR